jgi:hypothetical protein
MFFHVILAVAVANGPVVIARGTPRCNNVVATRLEDEVRGYERHTAKAEPNAWDERMAKFHDVMANMGLEEDVLKSVCPEPDFSPIKSQMDATRAWVFALESDIARAEYVRDCPAQELPVAAGFVAQAWLALVTATPEGTAATKLVIELTPKIKARAVAVSLTLPIPANTSNYWMTQVQATGRTAAQACPTPKQ